MKKQELKGSWVLWISAQASLSRWDSPYVANGWILKERTLHTSWLSWLWWLRKNCKRTTSKMFQERKEFHPSILATGQEIHPSSPRAIWIQWPQGWADSSGHIIPWQWNHSGWFNVRSKKHQKTLSIAKLEKLDTLQTYNDKAANLKTRLG